MFKRITFHLPRFSLRFFIYFLFGLVLLVLVAEGGYYFWRTKTAIEPLEIEGVFTTNIVNNEPVKAIVGTVKSIENRDLIVEYKGESIKVRIDKNALVRIVGEGMEEGFSGEFTESTILIGDRVNITDLKTLQDGVIEGSTVNILRLR